jgi:tripeptidyl-peptidase-1
MDAGNWLYSWAVSFVNRETVPYTISLSYGWNAADQCDITLCTDESSKEYVKRVDYEFAKMALRGVTVVVASGDAGSPGRTNEVCGGEGAETMFPIYPGSSPWVTSVGATYLIDDVSKNDPVEWTTPICQEFGCATSNREAVTTFSKTHWTSGAGFSNYAKTPVWQQDYVTAYLSSNNSMPSFRFFNQQGRAYPDVVALGHSCAVFDFWINGWMSFDGTSCSAPIFAGILSHLSNFQTRRGQPRLGFANPLLYEMKRNMPETFNLITEGNSACTEYTCCSKEFGFAATNMHWDPVKGLGSPNIGKMMEYLEKKQTKFISNASSKYFARAEVD